jgi:hypothetical protein
MIGITDFDLPNVTEEDDPLVSLRQHRREISDRFKTVGELTAYLKQFDSVEDALMQIRCKIAENERKPEA